MLVQEAPPLPAGMPLIAAADLQDHLMVASNDLERLQRLLDDASQALMGHFTGASEKLDAALREIDGSNQVRMHAVNEPHINELQSSESRFSEARISETRISEARQSLVGAITALQFQDMASQLIAHTTRRLRNCADRLASDAFEGDEDGEAVVEELPLRPNPVTQDEMDAGSVDLF